MLQGAMEKENRGAQRAYNTRLEEQLAQRDH
jgi:hypothetical protein